MPVTVPGRAQATAQCASASHGRPPYWRGESHLTGSLPIPGARLPAADGPALVGRETHLAALFTLLRSARQGSAGIGVLDGPPGIGRTALLDRVVERALVSGFTVLRCAVRPAGRPFETVHRLLGPTAAEHTDIPAVLTPHGSTGADQAEGAATGNVPQPVLHHLLRLLRDTAKGNPVLLVVDDAHAADPSSLRFLLHTARRMPGLRLALLVSRRAASGADGPAALGELAALPHTRVIRLPLLAGAAISRLTRERLGEEAGQEFAAACLAVTGGNPRLVGTVLDILRSRSAPATVQALDEALEQEGHRLHHQVLSLLDSHPAAVREAAVAMAVMEATRPRRPAWGPETTDLAEICARLAGLDSRAFAAALASLRSTGLLATGRHSGEVRHWPLRGTVRAAVLADLPPEKRSETALRAARLLLDGGASAEQVAARLIACDPPPAEPWAVSVLAEAAHQATFRGAPDHAAVLLRAVLPDPSSCEQDASALAELGMMETAVDLHTGIRRLARAAECIADPAERAAVLQPLAAAMVREGRPGDAVALLTAHAPAVRKADADQARILEAERLLASCEDQHRFSLAGEPPACLRTADDTPGGRALLAVRAAIGAVHEDHAEEAAQAARRVLARSVVGVDPAHTFVTAATALLRTGRIEEAAAVCRRITLPVGTDRSGGLLGLGAAVEAEAAQRQGRPAEAAALAKQAAAAVPRKVWGRALALPVATRVHALLDLGDIAGAEAAVREDAPEDTGGWQWSLFLCARGRLRLAQGRAAEALDDLLECGTREQAWGRTSPSVSTWWYWAAHAHLALGAPWRARALAVDAAARALRGKLRDARGAALHLAALCRPAAHARLPLLEQALTTLEDTPARQDLARVLIDYGAALHSSGHTTQARETLRRGLDLAHATGAAPLRKRAYRELHATGARPRRAATSGVDALTPSERQVAELAAAGATNRDIARTLTVTQRTVEVHLTSVYRKLGVSGRRGLRAMLAGEGPRMAFL